MVINNKAYLLYNIHEISFKDWHTDKGINPFQNPIFQMNSMGRLILFSRESIKYNIRYDEECVLYDDFYPTMQVLELAYLNKNIIKTNDSNIYLYNRINDSSVTKKWSKNFSKSENTIFKKSIKNKFQLIKDWNLKKIPYKRIQNDPYFTFEDKYKFITKIVKNLTIDNYIDENFNDYKIFIKYMQEQKIENNHKFLMKYYQNKYKMFSNNWFNLNQTKNSFEKLKNCIDVTSKITMIEVGCFEGQSTCYFLNTFLSHEKSKIYCIDTFSDSIEHSNEEKNNLYNKFIDNIKTTNNEDKVIIKKGHSFNKLCELNIQNIKADIIYIDGSHTASDVLADAVLSWKCCKIGGFIIFDDYLWDNLAHWKRSNTVNILDSPKIAIDSFVNIHFDKLELCRGWTSYQFIIRKLKE